MHLKTLTLLSEKYPTKAYYPFNLPVFHETRSIGFRSPVTFFVGENGTGKSTLLRALCQKCGIHIWQGVQGRRVENNPYEEALYMFINVEWCNGRVPGSFFGSETFRDFAQYLDEWAVADPEMLKYFGGKSLITQSHGQSFMTLFKARYRIKGLYFMDEPETALSPKSQLELLKVIKDMGEAGHAQFIIATHSPILLACPGAVIMSFDDIPVREVGYEETEHYLIYNSFMKDKSRYLRNL
ncbi:MAG: AAA family ATPase [Proteobacteria bacterium]|nr:AAA family ATPase [Desulfobacterales bacterium]MBL7102615.1 AAA family ATPase [Desulfobacteraceae bacterium]MBU0733922.1 AAA family ATPase [Pseudomonadota bacterium]MBL7173273.1 AAA family ATPase [Desulfobacteraceae bacterium]MBU0990794.1 AAA family ATPase [Pseudomonadota bacterium]